VGCASRPSYAKKEGVESPDKGDPTPRKNVLPEKAREALLDDEEIEAAHEVDDAARHIPGLL
jgi:hypothetical protein